MSTLQKTLSLIMLACPLAAALDIQTADGIAARLSRGGHAEQVKAGASEFLPHAAGRPLFRVREILDRQALITRNFRDGEWTRVSGVVKQTPRGLHLSGSALDMGLGLEATFVTHADRVEINGAVIDQRGKERSVELMCALPAATPDTRWHLDIVESVATSVKRQPLHRPGKADGLYALWLVAFDFDPEMGSVSVITPGGKERLLAVMARPGSKSLVDQRWAALVVKGVRESDFDNGLLRVRVANFSGGAYLLVVGSVHLMDGKGAGLDDEQATRLMQESETKVRDMSVASWDYAAVELPRRKRPSYGRYKGVKIWDGWWNEFVVRRGEHRVGGEALFASEEIHEAPDEQGRIAGLSYPWATITQQGRGGYTLAVSPEMPCQYRFQYDTYAREVQLVLSYGLSALPKRRELKGRAPFRLILYRSDDEWGFREAAKRYYDLAPELFRRRTDRFGFWYGTRPYYDYRGLEGLYAYQEVHEIGLYPRRFIKDRADWLKWQKRLALYFPRHSAAGILVMPYRHFHHQSLHAKPKMDGTYPTLPKTPEMAVQQFRQLAIPFANGFGHYVREVIESSTMRTLDGKMDVTLLASRGGGRAVFRTSVSPFLYDDQPDIMTNARTEMDFARTLFEAFPQAGGIYYDYGAGQRGNDFSPEHIRYARSPLVPGPAVSRSAGRYAFGRWMGEFLHRHGTAHFINSTPNAEWTHAWHVMAFDCFGIEWLPVPGGTRQLRFHRTMAGQKPVTDLKGQFGGDHVVGFRQYVQKLGLYGIFPPSMVYRFGSKWTEDDVAEWTAPFGKALQHMYLAGWQPVTHARCGDARLRVERYGPSHGRVYFAVHNPAFSTIEADLTIDAAALEMPPLAKAVVFFSDTPAVELRPAGSGRYRTGLRVRPGKLVVVEVGVTDVDDPRETEDYYPARHRAWDAMPRPPRLVARWDFDEGRGQTVVEDVDGRLPFTRGWFPWPEDRDPTWAAAGHSGAALEFDGRDDVATVRDYEGLATVKTFTVEMWVKPTARKKHARLFDYGKTTILFDRKGKRVTARIRGPSGLVTAVGGDLPLDQWAHVMMTYDGKEIRLFLNGRLTGRASVECKWPLMGAPLAIGNIKPGSTPFAGLIDEVMIWDYAKDQGDTEHR